MPILNSRKSQENIHNSLSLWIAQRATLIEVFGEEFYAEGYRQFNDLIDKLDKVITKG